MPPRLEVIGLEGLPEVRPGDDLTALVREAADGAGGLRDGDVLVLAQKIVSKAEDRFVDLRDVRPDDRARRIAAQCDKDPRQVAVILSESAEVLRHRPGVLIVRHRLGHVLANAGIDASNVPQMNGSERVLLLPEDPDGSAERLRAGLGGRIGVIVNDSPGRAWRVGSVGIAIGVAGVATVLDLRGRRDRDGREMQASELAVADEIAAAASIVMGQAAEGVPAAIVRGAAHFLGQGRTANLIRHPDMDLFR
ncbi:MAG: coenzyme F420-0:L-glutamate ligase [Minwuia sp.]|uniref:coenzyme F420-0:L-glutamate ligase n=1 Tax=Minwuia sp. TaxID=2493630 RepID=UPI003A87A282